ncbi:acetyl-CoA C-acetyltransferase [bacterium]|nr:acetyl-CoA C-acetyltransferase [FCB group bacterium]MBL7192080.1 acetyl-CoA C-acetyltransferase [bacterium]
MREVVIVSAVRTPIGSFMGSLSAVPAPKLGAVVIDAAVKRAGIAKDKIDEVIMGCVLQAGIGQAPARQAMRFAGIPDSTQTMTIHKVCGSGLKSVMLAAQAIALGDADIIVAGGMENMSIAPYYLPKARTGYRMGNGEIVDGMVFDGLWDPYDNVHMGNCAEVCAKEYKITREEQDAYAAESYTRAQKAIAEGLFKPEIVPVEIPQRKGDPIVVSEDEEPGKGSPAKFARLRPAFDKEGTVTAANASSINDGAAALVVMAADTAAKLGVKPIAKIIGQASFAQEPVWFTTAPAGAIKKVLSKTGLTKADIDLWEINEAFSVVAIVNNRLLELDPAKVNIRGGAVAFGHPIGASGARILTTLLYAMKDTGAKKGCAALCIGGGEASALIVERIE